MGDRIEAAWERYQQGLGETSAPYCDRRERVSRARDKVEDAAESGTLGDLEEVFDEVERDVLPHCSSAQVELLRCYESALAGAREALAKFEGRVAARREALEVFNLPTPSGADRRCQFPTTPELVTHILTYLNERDAISKTRACKALAQVRGSYEARSPLWRRLAWITVQTSDTRYGLLFTDRPLMGEYKTVSMISFGYSDRSVETWGEYDDYRGEQPDETAFAIDDDDDLVRIDVYESITAPGAPRVIMDLAFVTKKGRRLRCQNLGFTTQSNGGTNARHLVVQGDGTSDAILSIACVTPETPDAGLCIEGAFPSPCHARAPKPKLE